ncbi:nucleoside triphosphate pyrophosphohydrolase [Desulfonema limicola]|uniref:nucleoside triphosphate pyrophosphohydrolase n=1 Tax=Desulfonema limicola TaxID=45656 RepID=UPI001A9B364C|nr:nucleoside triphosphate pyrophosphohydrolase [Desulfonema limicola]
MEFKHYKSLDTIIERLRGENGCPWDRKQTPETMMIYLIEEVYELAEAIESENHDAICEELGDVLFQLLFIAKLFQEKNHFNMEDAARINAEKMINRHPHVFGDVKVKDTKEIRENWQKIKMKEKNHSAQKSILESIPANLPALMRAYRVSERAAGTGFDWDNISGVMDKVEEEWAELKAELGKNGDGKRTEEVSLEFGDVLFTLVNVARFAKIHPETALTDSTRKFEKRFKHMEEAVSAAKRKINETSRSEMDQLWENAKVEVKN